MAFNEDKYADLFVLCQELISDWRGRAEELAALNPDLNTIEYERFDSLRQAALELEVAVEKVAGVTIDGVHYRLPH